MMRLVNDDTPRIDKYEKNMFLNKSMKFIKRKKSKLEHELLSNFHKSSEKAKRNKQNLQNLIDEINNHVPEQNN